MSKKKSENVEYWLKRTGWTAIRYALTGKATGLPIKSILEMLGDEEIIRRLKIWDKIIKKEGT